MRKRGVSSIIAGILVIVIALTAVGAITAYYFWGLHAVTEENQFSNFLTYKDEEVLQATLNGSMLTIKNTWNYPSTVTYLMFTSPDNVSTFITENITLFPGGSTTLHVSGDPAAVLTSYGNEFWVSSTTPNPYFSTYAVTIEPTAGGTTSPAPGTYYYSYGSKVTISATPKSGNTFINWSGTGYGSYSGSSSTATVDVWSNITETANFAINTYTVTFTSSPSGAPISTNYGSGNTPYSITVNYGSSVSYTYGSSFSGGSGIQYVNPSPSSGSQTITGNTNINAQYTTQYYVTTSANPASGGSVSPSSEWVDAGTSVTFSETPNSGSGYQYIFTGWSGTYSSSSTSFSETVNGPITETASFSEQYYLLVSASPSNGGSVSGGGWYYPGSVAEVSESPSTGYHFVDWSTGSTSSAISITMNGPESVTAYFAINTYTVTFTSSPVEGAPISTNYGSGNTPYSITVDYGSTVSYTFGSSFSISSEPGTQYVNPNPASGSITVTSSQTINAQYTTQYYLTTSANPSSGGTVSPYPNWADAGSQVTISATPNAGYKFTGWSGSGSGSYSGSSSSYTITMNGPITETGNFATVVYTVTFTSSPSGAPISTNYGSGTTPYSIAVNYGSTVSYTYGSSFSGGSGVQYVSPSPATGSITVTSSQTINAQYTTQYYLTISAGSGGSVSPSSGWHNSGSSVTISATPNSNYYFVSWSGSGSGSYSGSSQSTTITMNNPISETAQFGADGLIYYNSYDYGTGYSVSSSVTLSGPGAYTISSGGSAYVIPGTYSLSYSNSQYGASVYSPDTPSSVSVSSGGSATITATYNTPTSTSMNIREGGGQLIISGQVTTADGGNIGSGQYVTVTAQIVGLNGVSTDTVSTSSDGEYSATFIISLRGAIVQTATTTFYETDGFLQSSASTAYDVSPLTVSISASPTSGTAPLTVSFTSTVSGGSGGYTYSWSFGDGGTSSSANPSHTYSSAGTYTATLTVTDSNNDQDTSNSITITVSATWSVSLSASGDALTATASQSVTSTSYFLVIWDETTDSMLTYTTTGTLATSTGTPGNTYIAYVGPSTSSLSGEVAESSSVSLANAWTVSLSASGDTLTATTSQDVGPTPYYLVIWDESTSSALTSAGSGTSTSGTGSSGNTYYAYVGSNPSSPSGAVATSNTITLSSSSPLSGYYTYSPSETVTVNTYVTITAHGTGGTGQYSYVWGDGDNSNSQTFYFTTTGTHTGQVTIYSGSQSVIIHWSETVTSSSSPLNVGMYVSTTSGTAPLSVSFSASASGGTGGYTYYWTFGDGYTSTSASPSHTYSSAGTYTARVTVTDSVGDTASQSTTISVSSSGGGSSVWSVSLSRSGDTLTATTNQNVGPTPYWLVIWDESTNSMLTAAGSGTSVSGGGTPGNTYIAYVGGTSGPSGAVAVSSPITL